jgi:tetratricopeptide (TPR) repeat protein
MQYRLRMGSWCLFILLLWTACATTPSGPSSFDQRREIRRLIYEVRKNPRSSEAFRDLGAVLFDMKWYKFSVKSLIKSFRMNRRDAKTLYYLGQLLELRNQTDRALMIYGRFTQVSKPAEYRYKLEAKYDLLTRSQSRDDIHRMLKSEALLQMKTSSPDAVAVLPLKYMGLDDQYSPMGKGIAEMMMTDLSQVHSLEVVERVRVQALYDELSLSQTGLMDVTSTPKMGKLLGAGKVVQGNFAILDDTDIHLDVAYNDILGNKIPKPLTMKDEMPQLFKLEKDMVFQIIDQMGIEISQEEAQRIQHIPTKNIQAFMAYCLGLEMEDKGNFTKASEYYKRATQIDPGYEEAKNKMALNLSMASASSISPRIEVSQRLPVSPRVSLAPSISRETLIYNRLQNVSRNIGSTFIPGRDSRKSTEEFTTSQLLSETLRDITDFDAESFFNSITLPDLPRPPAPPGQ